MDVLSLRRREFATTLNVLKAVELLDHIHHRGQFSVYLRLAGAKVPSIYGPTADAPWPAAAAAAT